MTQRLVRGEPTKKEVQNLQLSCFGNPQDGLCAYTCAYCLLLLLLFWSMLLVIFFLPLQDGENTLHLNEEQWTEDMSNTIVARRNMSLQVIATQGVTHVPTPIMPCMYVVAPVIVCCAKNADL